MSSERAAPSVLGALPRATLIRVQRHLEAAAPDEGCGVITATPTGALRFHPSPNLAPAPRRAFTLDLRVILRAESRGERLRAILHSHPEAPAHPSAEDLAQATLAGPDGPEPVFPGVETIISSLQGGRCVEHRAYRHEGAGGFVGIARRPASTGM